MTHLARSVLCTAALLTTSILLTGCSNDKPAVCTSMDDLRSSVNALKDDAKNIDLSQPDLSQAQDDLSQVKSNLTQVKSDAKTQFATELDALDQAESDLESSVSSAASTLSATTIAAVITAVQSFGTAFTALDDAVKNTC